VTGTSSGRASVESLLKELAREIDARREKAAAAAAEEKASTAARKKTN
jgi:hypothetical protein